MKTLKVTFCAMLAGMSFALAGGQEAEAQRQRPADRLPEAVRGQARPVDPRAVRDPAAMLNRSRINIEADGALLVFAELDADGLTVWRVMADGTTDSRVHAFGPANGRLERNAGIGLDGVEGFYYFWASHNAEEFQINYPVSVTGTMAGGSTLSFVGDPARLADWLRSGSGQSLIDWHQGFAAEVQAIHASAGDFLDDRRNAIAADSGLLVHRAWSALSQGAGIWQISAASAGSFAPYTGGSLTGQADAPWLAAVQGGQGLVEDAATDGLGTSHELITEIEAPDLSELIDRCSEEAALEGFINGAFERYPEDTPDDPEEGEGGSQEGEALEAQADELSNRIEACFEQFAVRWEGYDPDLPSEQDFVDAGAPVENAAQEAETLANNAASQFESDFSFELNALQDDVAGDWSEAAWTPDQNYAGLLAEVGLPPRWLHGSGASGRGRGDPCDAPANLTLNVSGPLIYIGSAGNDHIVAGNNANLVDIVIAGPGDDCVEGRAGYDLVFGGGGRDEIDGGANSDLIFGGSGSDVIRGGGGQSLTVTVQNVSLTVDLGDVIFGGADNDTIDGVGAGFNAADASYYGFTDLVFAGAGDDTVNGQGGIDILFGQLGGDNLSNPGHGRIRSEANGITRTTEFGSVFFGNRDGDRIAGGRSHDLAFGHTGNDRIDLGDSADLAFGGRGRDEIDGQGGMDLIFGDGFADRPIDAADTLRGGPGTDLLFGQHHNDVLHANAGQGDLLFGNDGDDDTFGDQLTLHFGGLGRDLLQGGSGIDVMLGQDGNDTLRGNDGPDVGFGGAGDDHLISGNGVDLMSGDGESDYLEGGHGVDLLLGGAGSDYLDGQGEPDVLVGVAGADCLNGGDGLDLLIGGGGDDCLRPGAGGSLMIGGDEHDIALGGPGSDLFLGNNGDDQARGGGGIDLLHGGDGDDVLAGEAGEDLLIAGSELAFTGTGVANCLDGGAGTDFAIGGNRDDTILDVDLAFGRGGDDTIGQTRIAFGGVGHDRLSSGTLSGLILQFGSLGDDDIDSASPGLVYISGGYGEDDIQKTGNGLGLLRGRVDADRIEAAAGYNLVFANSGNDTVNVHADPDEERDIAFGNTGNDDLYGNSAAGSNRRDVLIGGIGFDDRERDVSPTGWFSLSGVTSACTLQVSSCETRQPPTNAGAGR